MKTLYTVIAAIVALGPLIVFHELGHYTVARLCGVKVLRFSIGFGKALYAWRSPRGDRTEWVLAAVPLGGYVQMLDEREGPVESSEAHRAFNRQRLWRRAAIVVAGPLANLLLALLIYAAIFMVGTDEPRAIIAAPAVDSPAAMAGLRAGDRIDEVEHQPVASWKELRWALIDRAVAHQPVELTVSPHEGGRRAVTLDFGQFNAESAQGDPWVPIGLSLYNPPLGTRIGHVEPGSPAAAAGLMAGEQVIALEGLPVTTWEALVKAAQARPAMLTQITIVSAQGEQRTVALTPASVESAAGAPVGRIGIGPAIDEAALAGLVIEVRYGPLAALTHAAAKTWEVASFSVRMFGRMLTGELSWRNLSGPVSIAQFAGHSASLGLVPYCLFIALISISLGVLNLLPIPVLDGGHLLYYFFEMVMGRPLPLRIIDLGQRAGLGVLIVLMACALFNDILRSFH